MKPKRLICRVIGHRFVAIAEAKRKCSRCAWEEWVFENPYPRVGQPKYVWKPVNFDELRF